MNTVIIHDFLEMCIIFALDISQRTYFGLFNWNRALSVKSLIVVSDKGITLFIKSFNERALCLTEIGFG